VEKNLTNLLPKLSNVEKEDRVYVMVDGSMLNTRKYKWKEIKLGRIFNERKIIPLQKKRSEIVESIYVSHMGGVKKFLPKIERHLVDYNNKVFIGDGAPWIWNWVEDNYPGAQQILDFFHAKEKIVILANHQFNNQERKKSWIKEQTERLKNDEVEIVIKEIKGIRSRNQTAKEHKAKTIKYYEDHSDKMLYGTYISQGLLIGSGPIEAAHRSVLQQRMKLSGQKWNINGINAIANLRCYRKSKAWEIIKTIIRAA